MAELLRARGYDVIEEYPLDGGKAIDLVAERDGRRIALEIETGKSDAAGNVRKCLDAGMDKVVVVATSADVRDVLAADFACHAGVAVTTGGAMVSEPTEW